ncbi:MAG: glycosyl transferase group 1 [Planctomycetota bacterium]|nr:glycosyl transferase group 1 [Planctomycetota bacterium]
MPYGVGHQFRPPGEEESEWLKARHPLLRRDYVLYVGSLEPRKNLGRLFSAWAQILRDCPGVTLVIAGTAGRIFSGTGFERLPSRVHLLGRIGDGDLRALYGNAMAFVYPSLYEGFGLPPLEAMACGTPVVVSDAASMPEAVGDAALLVDPLEIDSIAFGLRAVLSDCSLRTDLQRRGLERAREFTWERAAKRTWQVLSDAAMAP